MEGVVKWYNVKKGYGFVKGEDGKDYFVHFSALKPGAKLFENTKVDFEATDTEKGLQAKDVNSIGGADAPPERSHDDDEAPAEDEHDMPEEDEGSEDFGDEEEAPAEEEEEKAAE